MKTLLVSLIIFVSIACHAQNIITDSLAATPGKVSYTKAVITLDNNSKHAVEEIGLMDSQIRIVYDKKKLPVFSTTDSVAVLAITDIRSIKVRKDAFFEGALIGAVPGFLLGYLVGYGSYDRDNSLTDERNKEKRNNKGGLYGFLGAIPTAIVGGAFSSVFTKKAYRINGDRTSLDRLFEKL